MICNQSQVKNHAEIIHEEIIVSNLFLLSYKTLLFDMTLHEILQTCHSIEMKNLDLTNKKLGSGGKNRDHGPIGYKKK